ncbi:MAG: GntR family transcriptional regulator [Planctomycetota bacterium]|jgi:DNA-binding transcriptional regulator YhcF (GntR family)
MSPSDFTLDPDARSPLYRQLQDQVRYAISVGELGPGDSLPSIRELEERLGVNRNTVRRAYLELQLEGTLVIRQGREAVVAERPPAGTPEDPHALAEVAESFAVSILQRAESMGLDSVQLAEYVVRAAQEHDARYPRCAFLECSMRQADDFARDAEARFGRRVVSLDLHDLERDPGVVPSSVRFILTPHWHAAEANELFRAGDRAIFPVGVRIKAGCGRQLRALKGSRVGVVVRDPESMPGFRDRLRSHVGQRAIRAAVADDRAALASFIDDLDHVVYTPPCASVVREVMPARVDTHELLFEPVPDDLDAVRAKIFPSLMRAEQGTGEHQCEATSVAP